MKRDGRVAGIIIAGVLAVGMVWPASADAQEAVAGEFERLLDIIRQAPHPVVALGAAHELGDWRTFLVPQEYAQALADLADDVDDPLVEFIVHRQAARAGLETGAVEEFGGNAGFAAASGCLVDWNVVGPFENASMQGFYDRLEPEEGRPGPYSGRLVDVNWRALGASHHLCSYNLSARVQPSTSAVAYLSTTVTVDERTDAHLLVGSQSAYRIWVNGEPAGQRTGEFGLGLDAEGWPLRLEAGDNEILVKLGSTGQGGLSWVARLVDDSNQVLEGFEARPSSSPEAVRSFGDREMTARGVFATIRDGADSVRPAATQLWAALLWRELHSDDASTPWRNVAERLESRVDELSGREQVRFSRLYEEHWRRQAVLDAAVEVSGDDALVRWYRAHQRGSGLTHIEWEEQRRELERLVEENPDFLLARHSLASWLDSHEGGGRALRMIENWDHGDREQTPAWVRLAADLNERSGDGRRAAELRQRAAELYQMSGAFGWQLIREAMVAGRPDEAMERVQRFRQVAPWARGWALQEAILHQAEDRLVDALSVVDALIEESPGDATLLERRAGLLVAAGDVEGAMEAIEAAIALRPQATRLIEYLEHLQPESDRFYEPWQYADIRQLAQDTPAGAQSFDIVLEQRIHQVASNGLARQYVQQAQRVIRDEGVDSARSIRVSHRRGDERVEVLGVRVLKADGTISEDFNQWRSGDSRQRTTTYNDTVFVNLRANNVDVGDIVEFRYVVHQVANENFRGDYFGNVTYVQRTRPVGLMRYAVIHPESWNLFFRPPATEHRRWENALPDGQTLPPGQQVTAFEMRNIPRVFTDNDQPGHADVYDHIVVSNRQSYDEIGRWWWNLIEEQLVIDDAIRETVAELTQGLDSDEARVEAIYDFVARNTRYLHLGLGIHGWKPYRTSTILRNRYGDCKDKAALLKVMLNEAGIDAEMALVRTRRLGGIEDFPASMHVFNHAVTYVPSLDLFLDATAEFNGPYELTSMNHGAQALIVSDGGATRWVTMPIDDSSDNLFRQDLEVDLTGEVPVVTGRIEAHGSHAVSFRRTLEDPERRHERFEQQLARTFPGLDLIEAEYENLNDLMQPTRIRYTAEVPGVLRGGEEGRSLYPYGTPQDLLSAYARESTRHQDRMFRVPFANQSEVRYRLPAATAVERIPDDTSIESPFGRMAVTYRSEEGELVVDIQYSIDVQRVAVADYAEFRQFVSEMHEALNETIRLIDEEGN